jgi:small-conductance mechanosensitive channel
MEQLNKFLNTALISFGDIQLTVSQILAVTLLVVVGFLLARVIDKRFSSRLTARKMNADVVHLIRRLFYIVVIVVLIFTVLDLLNVPLTAFAFISGAVAIGVGFGAQNIINNFISGWILMWERPIRIGDTLEVGDMRGRVEAINTRSTRLKRIDGVRLLIPNSQLLENTVINWTIVDRLLRSSVRVGVQYGTNVLKVKELLEQVVAEHHGVLEEPAPNIVFEDFGDSALVFDVYFWIEVTSERNPRGVRSDLRFAIDEVFKANNIIIAYPQRDIHIDGAIQIAKPGES